MAEKPREQGLPPASADSVEDALKIEANLRRIAHMFEQHRSTPLMRKLCRLAIKCAQERLV